jgi:nucleoside-diphosphate-sugar epimerase
MRLLLTGVSGFVGGRLAARLVADGHLVSGMVRRGGGRVAASLARRIELIEFDDLATDRDLSQKVRGVDVVIHLAARVHVMHENAGDPLSVFRLANVVATRRLAAAAAAAGVGRFVYVSSIKVNGERTSGRPFSADDRPAPQDPYGVSKAEAEQVLREVCDATSMQFVIVRPPLVYGAGVKGNFRRLIGLVRRGLPLPFGALQNQRSMVSLDNLVDLLVRCAQHPDAANRVFLVSDGNDWGTPRLIRAIAGALQVRDPLFRVPPALLYALGRVTGKRAMVDRLCGSLQLDIERTREVLDWAPPQSPEDAVREAVAAYLAAARHD